MVREYIYKEIQEQENTFDIHNIRDFIDLYLKAVKTGETKDKKYVSKENTYRVINELFLAGAVTTSVGLQWTCVFMIEYPDVQKKCQQELEKVVGHRVVRYADRNNLPYVCATIIEILRRSSIGPIAVTHLASENITISGYDMPKGTWLVPNLYASHMDKKYWEEPETFNPERFLDEAGNMKKNDALVPFSEGPRVCLGESLARMKLFLILTNLLQRFTFSRVEEDPRHSLDSYLGITMTPVTFRLKAQFRQ